jgi:hypothetical protein
MPAPVHPGTVTFLDGATQQVVRTAAVGELPEPMRFAPTEHGLVPVVKVVSFAEGDQRIIREYGPGGELLRSTVQVRPPKARAG